MWWGRRVFMGGGGIGGGDVGAGGAQGLVIFFPFKLLAT